MTTDTADTEAIMKAAEMSDRVLATGLVNRLVPNPLLLKKALDQGTYGRLILVGNRDGACNAHRVIEYPNRSMYIHLLWIFRNIFRRTGPGPAVRT